MARPTKLSPAVCEKISMAIAGCSSYRAAAMFAGVADSTLRAWLARGRAEQLVTRPAGAQHKKLTDREAPYLELLQSVERASARAEVRAAALIAKAGESDWRAAAWFLERRDPETFGHRLALEHAGADGGPVEISTLGLDLGRLSEAELKTLQKIVSHAEQ